MSSFELFRLQDAPPMDSLRPLRGGCQCGRNTYVIEPPAGSSSMELAQVLFNTESIHQIPLATPLAAFLRVPLSWYHSTTQPFLDDESHAAIRRVYTHPSRQHEKRHFCGFCGTPLLHWSEQPPSEADFLNVTLCSLLSDDLRDLEELGLIPDPDEEEAEQQQQAPASTASLTRESHGVPWFDSLVQDSRLGRLRRTQGQSTSQDGTTRVEWEILEWTDGDDTLMGDNDVEQGAEAETAPGAGSVSPAKRKLQDTEGMEMSA